MTNIDLVKRMKATLSMSVISHGSSGMEYSVAERQFKEAIDRIKELEATDVAACYAQSVYVKQQEEITALKAKLARVEEELRWSKKDAGFYHSCALSGEVPKDGSQPSALKEQT